MIKILRQYLAILWSWTPWAGQGWSFCERCWLPWNKVEPHIVWWSVGGRREGGFALCEYCWRHTSDTEKVSYFLATAERHRWDEDDMTIILSVLQDVRRERLVSLGWPA